MRRDRPKTPEKDGSRRPSIIKQTHRLKHYKNCPAANNTSGKFVRCTCDY